MYAVAWFDSTERSGHVFPNVFPDYDMAIDCVIYQIKSDHGVELNTLETDTQVGGQSLFYFEDTVYIIGKLFNFNPKGM